MSDNSRTEVTDTGIVRRRNENGYIIHPDRHDTGGGDRRLGWSLVIAAVLTFLISLPSYGLKGIFPLLLFGSFGAVVVRRGRRKRHHAGGYHQKHRTLDRDQDSDTHSLLKSSFIWPYRHYWALLGFGSVGATVVVDAGPLGSLVPLVTFIGIVALAFYGWIRRGSSS
jgi:hypothetical protein